VSHNDGAPGKAKVPCSRMFGTILLVSGELDILVLMYQYMYTMSFVFNRSIF